MTPVYAANNLAFCQLKSGEYICVDTNSLDAIDYLLGFDMEAHILPVFQRFLTPASVVLDIGANVGLYTVTSATMVGRCGHLYAFEGNPYTFQLLRRSAYANKILKKENIVLTNALVSDKSGRGRLFFHPQELGGATVRDVVKDLNFDWQSVEVDQITIDQFIDKDVKVDLAKIDVEGHEPFVLKGMEQTISRSPEIRIILEFFEAMVEPTFGADRFRDYIFDLGFEICLIGPKGSLRQLERDEKIRGENYLFLTRSPEIDIDRKYSVLPINCFFSGDGQQIHGKELMVDGTSKEIHEGSTLTYGPYISLTPGRYVIWIVGSIVGDIGVRLSGEVGRAIFGETVLDTLDTPIVVDLPEGAENFEIVTFQPGTLKEARLREFRVTQGAL